MGRGPTIKNPSLEILAQRASRTRYRRKMGIPLKQAEPPLCEHKDQKRKGDGLCRKCYKKRNGFKFLLKHRYGTTVEWYEQRLTEQGGVCAICKGVSMRRLSVDHNHQTGEVRGLLCVPCNAGIGNFKERADLMYAAVQYLGRWS